MDPPILIGIIGDFDPSVRSHLATIEALKNAAKDMGVPLVVEWLPTLPLRDESGQKGLETFDALWAAPGSPYKSRRGALKSIQFAREKGWPFIGT